MIKATIFKIKCSGTKFVVEYNGNKSIYTTPQYPVTENNIAEILKMVTQYFITEYNVFPCNTIELNTYIQLTLSSFIVVIDIIK